LSEEAESAVAACCLSTSDMAPSAMEFDDGGSISSAKEAAKRTLYRTTRKNETSKRTCANKGSF